MTDIWTEKPEARDGYSALIDTYEAQAMDAWLEKLKAHYEPYDKLLKAEPLMPMDIKSVLKKEGMPILIDEGWFNNLKDKAKTFDELLKTDNKIIYDLSHKLEAVKKHFKEIPTKFVSEAHAVLDRGTNKHRVWDFEKWFVEAKEILEAEE